MQSQSAEGRIRVRRRQIRRRRTIAVSGLVAVIVAVVIVVVPGGGRGPRTQPSTHSPTAREIPRHGYAAFYRSRRRVVVPELTTVARSGGGEWHGLNGSGRLGSGRLLTFQRFDDRHAYRCSPDGRKIGQYRSRRRRCDDWFPNGAVRGRIAFDGRRRPVNRSAHNPTARKRYGIGDWHTSAATLRFGRDHHLRQNQGPCHLN